MTRFLSLITALSLLSITSCTTTSEVSLDYVPSPGHVQPGAAEYSTQPFVDRRDQGAMELGTVRTQLGTPIEKVITKVPVASVVSNAFAYGLQGRGMLASRSAARFIITGEVLDLRCQLLVHPYGYAKVRVNILEADSGRIIHSAIYEGERQSSAYVPGSGTPVPVLRDLTSGALQDAVDRALDDPAMRKSSGGRSSETTGWQPGMI
ncbi:MAG: hypothetical protein ABL974_18230 [Prosthecobacter sp.]